jgi:archaetidylinositol phosphate synthase
MLTAQARAAHTIGLTPNAISVIGAALALSAAFSYIQWQTSRLYLAIALILLLASGFCDALDGAVARLYQQTSSFGGFLDSVLDRYADAAIFISLILSGLCSLFWGIIALTNSLLVSYTRARAEVAGAKMETIGIAERPERIIILTIATTIAIIHNPASTIDIAIILISVLTSLTVIQRSIYAYRNLKKTEPKPV